MTTLAGKDGRSGLPIVVRWSSISDSSARRFGMTRLRLSSYCRPSLRVAQRVFYRHSFFMHHPRGLNLHPPDFRMMALTYSGPKTCLRCWPYERRRLAVVWVAPLFGGPNQLKTAVFAPFSAFGCRTLRLTMRLHRAASHLHAVATRLYGHASGL